MEYSNPILDALIDIKKGNFDKKNQQYLYPIVRWNSGNDKYGKMLNFDKSFYLNQYLFIAPYKIIMSYIYFNYRMHNMRGKPALFLKYPKKTKTKENKKLDVIVKYLKVIYSWSNQDIERNMSVIKLYIDDDVFIEWLDNYVGFEKNEKKLFKIKCNLKVKKNNFKETTIRNSKSLLDF